VGGCDDSLKYGSIMVRDTATAINSGILLFHFKNLLKWLNLKILSPKKTCYTKRINDRMIFWSYK